MGILEDIASGIIELTHALWEFSQNALSGVPGIPEEWTKGQKQISDVQFEKARERAKAGDIFSGSQLPGMDESFNFLAGLGDEIYDALQLSVLGGSTNDDKTIDPDEAERNFENFAFWSLATFAGLSFGPAIADLVPFVRGDEMGDAIRQIFLMFGATSAASAPMKAVIQECMMPAYLDKMRSEHRGKRPSLKDAAEMYSRGMITQEKMREQLEYEGIRNPYHEWFDELKNSPLNANQVRMFARYGFWDRDFWKMEIQRSGISPEAQEYMLDAGDYFYSSIDGLESTVPGDVFISELSRSYRNGVIDDDILESVVRDADLSDEHTEGIIRYCRLARASTFKWGDLGDYEDLYEEEMISEQQLRQKALETEVSSKEIDHYMSLQTMEEPPEPPSWGDLRDYEKMYDEGLVTTEELRLKALNTDVPEELIDEYMALQQPEGPGWGDLGDYRRLYTEGIISRDRLTEKALETDVPQEEIDHFLSYYESRRFDWGDLNDYEKMYSIGLIDGKTLEWKAGDTEVPTDELEHYLALQKLDIDEDDIRETVALQIVSPEDGMAALQEKGYTEDEALLIMIGEKEPGDIINERLAA